MQTITFICDRCKTHFDTTQNQLPKTWAVITCQGQMIWHLCATCTAMLNAFIAEGPMKVDE